MRQMPLFKPSHARFARIVVSAIRRAGLPEPIEYDDDSQALVFAHGQDKAYFHLGNAYAEYCESGLFGGRDVLQRWMASLAQVLSEEPMSPEETVASLLPRVRDRWYYESLRMQVGLRGLDTTMPVTLEFTDGLYLELVVDSEYSLRSVTDDQLEELGLDFNAALAKARDNLWQHSNENFIDLGDGVYRSPWSDNHDASRMFLHDLIWQLPVRGRHVATIPNRDTLLVTGADNLPGLQRMAELTLEAYKHERQVSASPYVLDNGSWAPFPAPPDKATRQALHKLHVADATVFYGEQKDLLNAIHEKSGEDIFVASLTGVSDNNTGEWFSWCSWGENVVSMLPRADKVMLARGEPRKPELLGFAKWDDLRAAAGDLMKPLGMYPERYRVDTFLTPDQLAQIRLEQTG